MLNKQAKVLRQAQIRAVLDHLNRTRHPIRNRAIFMLSFRAGLRAKEIAQLTWSMVTDPDGNVSRTIRLTNMAAKGESGGAIPMARDLQKALVELREFERQPSGDRKVVRTERSPDTSPQVIVNLFRDWFHALGFEGCSSHSGRRTFITMTARNIGRFGGSLRDVQALARHSSLAMTQRYIEVDSRAMQLVVDGW